MKSLLRSRKFKLTLGALLGIVGTAVAGEITTAQAVQAAVVAIATNVLGIAIEDSGQKSAGK